MDYAEIIRKEISEDPLKVGYASMTTQEVSDSLNSVKEMTVAKVISTAEMMPLVSSESFNKVFDHPRYSDFQKSVDEQSHQTVCVWIAAFTKRGCLTPQEYATLIQYVQTPISKAGSRCVELGLPEMSESLVKSAGVK